MTEPNEIQGAGNRVVQRLERLEWRNIQFEELRPGDRFRMWDGEYLHKDRAGNVTWVANSAPFVMHTPKGSTVAVSVCRPDPAFHDAELGRKPEDR